ncbi:Uu.00g002590.m01.CDS01 [Anthostomella pinea]|uniref:Uu.00g002590.m01.CDS01 n=1 Tax=Anthostomella pinea TaxID=933095 RepID=A0AAI8VJH9_9PEZI|nr:Uu.00g002590.m01.CDS01 [Anthostomella pinea]
MPAGYKPSPLGYGSPRSSPFRRPESPSSPTALRQSSPTPSPTKVGSLQTPSRFASNSTSTGGSESWTARKHSQADIVLPSQTLGSPVHMTTARALPTPPQQQQTIGHGNALTQLQPAQVRVLRDGFQILDRGSDGVVNREDVAEMLTQLGLPASASDVSQFFPPAGPQTMTLAVFLNSIATTLAAMSPSAELLSAFSAFDDDDSGQVDLAELRDALLHTAPEPGERALTAAEVDKIVAGFSGRRAFSKSMANGGLGKRGEVFRYQDFVTSIVGGNGASEPSSHETSED